MNHHLKSNDEEMCVLDVSPQSAGWEYLSFRIVNINQTQTYFHTTDNTEIALVPLSGAGRVQVNDKNFSISRSGVFQEKPQVLYVPPGKRSGCDNRGPV